LFYSKKKNVFITLWYDIDGMGPYVTQELFRWAEAENRTATFFLINTVVPICRRATTDHTACED